MPKIGGDHGLYNCFWRRWSLSFVLNSLKCFIAECCVRLSGPFCALASLCLCSECSSAAGVNVLSGSRGCGRWRRSGDCVRVCLVVFVGG